jgi:outer membrane protein insertion porin family
MSPSKCRKKSRNTIGFSGGVVGIGGSFLGGNYETNNFSDSVRRCRSISRVARGRSNIVLSFSEPYFSTVRLSLGFSVFHSNYKYDQARELFGLDPRNLPSVWGWRIA